jgi:hypothetical protein
LFDWMLYLIDETRDRFAIASEETRERFALTAGETRERMAYAGEGLRLRAEQLADLARTRLALVLAVAVAVLAGGFLIARGGDDGGGAFEPLEATQVANVTPPAVGGVTLVDERGFTLSLPSDWVRTDAPDGAVFAAQSADGSAQTTLWVERNSNLDFDGFVQQSLGGLDSLGEGARVTDRVDGPTIESSSAELRAEVPLDGNPAGPYRVTLRAAGPYRYYLATSIAADAPPQILADAELLGSSLRPEVRLQGVDSPQ